MSDEARAPNTLNPPDFRTSATREAKASALRRAGIALVSELSLESLLSTLVEQARELTGARYGALGVLGPDGAIARFIASGLTEEERARIGAPPTGRGVLGLLIREKTPIRLVDIARHRSSTGFPPGHPPMHTFLGVPILSRGQVYGNLYLTEREGGSQFTEEDEETIVLFAAFAAVALDNARLYEEARQRSQESEALLHVGRAMVRSLRLEEIFQTIVGATATLLQADKAHLFVMDQTSSTLRPGATHGFRSNVVEDLTIRLGTGHVGRVADHGEPLIVQDNQRDHSGYQPLIDAEDVASCAHVPIRIAGEIYGVLSVDFARPHAVPSNAVPILQWMADRAAIAIRNAELYRRMTEERNALDAIFQSMGEGVYTVDREFRVLRTNDVAPRLAGQTQDDVIGLPCRQAFGYVDDRGRSICETSCPALEAMRTGLKVRTREVFMSRGQGKELPVDLSAGPLRDQDGNIIGAVEVVQDVRHRHAAEELREDIISLVSHELRTPLGHIKGYASSLIQPDVQFDALTQQEFLAGIVTEADRMSRLVSDILELSRMETGRQAGTEREPISLEGPVQAGVSQVRTFTRNHRVRIRLPKDLPLVLAAHAQVERVISNLVENAAKYSPEGTLISVTARADPEQVRVCVGDQGIGIPVDQTERIFEKFVRLPGPGGRSTPGTGLGLPLCRVIVEAHGGRIWVESVLGKGSRFFFTLPRVDSTNSGQTSNSAPGVP